jgi:Amt family ammonium transporter
VLELIRDPAVARSLCFDIAEAAILENLSQAVTFMEEVRKRGCKIALDDFAAGLSTLQSLKRMPVDFLKIDAQVVGDLGADPVDRSMVEAFTKVANALGIATIAERVETAESLARITELGIDLAQGYHLARPAPLEELEETSDAVGRRQR